jgi:hypothetical protein
MVAALQLGLLDEVSRQCAAAGTIMTVLVRPKPSGKRSYDDHQRQLFAAASICASKTCLRSASVKYHGQSAL